MSKPRVIITLGRTGQVVERGGTMSEFTSVGNDTGLMLGRKRSIGERFGSNGDGLLSSNKWQRGDGIKWNPGVDDRQISQNDLRLKLMRKRLGKQIHSGMEEHSRMDDKPSASRNLQQRPGMKETSLLRQVPSGQYAANLHQVDSPKKFYSRAVNGLEARSPDDYLRTSRGLTPPRNFDRLQQGTSVRATDASTSKPFPGNVVNTSRPTGYTPVMMKSAPGNANPVTQVVPMSSIVQKKLQVVEETVAGLLQSLGLGKYEIIFRAEEVDILALKQMGDKDLKEIGIPMGPRKKILLALLPRSKRQTT
ncbi:Sterile alpha motif (SAM) domain-containing protein [Quillaja saponaria]|uniref:Sterile alpha motif (SAM) domain-containing protein n=1 Tax=Quillaja saponaria TaxID=32244 RepID=A0AAD7KNK1_QUISA|nr:Sterile alpha motif (SAM) domain-containing protein [Quillaja saponaria]